MENRFEAGESFFIRKITNISIQNIDMIKQLVYIQGALPIVFHAYHYRFDTKTSPYFYQKTTSTTADKTLSLRIEF